jgi:predicted dehydrogenase
MDSTDRSRRDFLKVAAASSVLGAPRFLLAADTPGAEGDKCKKVSANDRVGLATIGIGGQGNSDTKAALKVPGVELVAVADVYQGRLERAREVYCDQIAISRDYREILARPDVDAVIVATPDHWHARVVTDALAAGKHVYCEKPMVQTIEEGQKLVEAEKRSGRIVQVGSQRVSSVVYHKAKELLASGAIGKLNMVQAWWNRNDPIGAWQYTIPADASPSTVDWERFLGHAPKRAFEPIRLFRWRNYRDYGTGVAGDLFVHLFSGLHVVTGALGPTRVMSTGGLRKWDDGRDVPDVMLGLYDYPKTEVHPEFTVALSVNFADGGGGGEEGFRFVGDEGVLSIARDGVTVSRRAIPGPPGYTIDTFPKAAQEVFLKEYKQKYPEGPPELHPGKEEKYRRPDSYSEHDHHLRNFVEAIREKKTVVEDATFGLRAAAPALLSNSSHFEGRPVRWDPKALKIAAPAKA